MALNFIEYNRKSSESEDRQVLSLDSQHSELTKIRTDRQLNVGKFVQEAKSAKVPSRRVGFNLMLSLIEKKEFNAILVWHPDRLSRNPIDAARIIDLMDRGLLLQVVTPGQTFNSSPPEKMWLAFLMIQAKMNNDQKGVDVKRGMKIKAELGWYPFPSMNGYLNTPERNKGYRILVKDPERFDTVRKMWDLMLTGVYTVAQVYKIVNREWGYKNRKGKEISRSNLYEMFSHPFYYGYFKLNGVWYKGKHEPMVTKNEWDKVRKFIHRTNVPHSTQTDHLFVDLLKCGNCNFSITATRKIKRYKRTNREAIYTYYHCTHKNRCLDCKQKPVTELDLEQQIIRILEAIDIESDFKDWAKKYYRELNEYESKHVIDSNLNLKRNISEIDKKLDTLLDLMLSLSITKEAYDNKRHDLLLEKASLEEKLGKKDDWLSKTDKVLNTAFNIKNKYLQKSQDEKRMIIRSIGSNLFLKDGLVRPELEKAYFYITDSKKSPEKYFTRIEPGDYSYLSPQTLDLAMKNPTWLPLVDAFCNRKIEFGFTLQNIQTVFDSFKIQPAFA